MRRRRYGLLRPPLASAILPLKVPPRTERIADRLTGQVDPSDRQGTTVERTWALCESKHYVEEETSDDGKKDP